MSDDGRYGITLIVFVGSVFSTRYARARARGPAEPLNFCAFNVALYGPERRWAMTERPRHAWHAQARDATLGPSHIAWNGDALECEFDERCSPFGERLKGRLRLVPTGLGGHPMSLEPTGEHRWYPVAPSAHVEVQLDHPALRFRGHGYHDANQGDSPLESRFRGWNWCRARLPSGQGSVVVYDRLLTDGSLQSYAGRFAKNGECETVELAQEVSLGSTPWGIERQLRADRAASADSVRTRALLADSPFYARSLVEATLLGERCLAVHESLSLARFEKSWVRFLLPFKTRYES